MDATEAFNGYKELNKVSGPIHNVYLEIPEQEVQRLSCIKAFEDEKGVLLASELHSIFQDKGINNSELTKAFSRKERSGYSFRYFCKEEKDLDKLFENINSIGYEFNLFYNSPNGLKADEVYTRDGELWTDFSHLDLEFNSECNFIGILVWRIADKMLPEDFIKAKNSDLPTLRDSLVGMVLLKFR